MKIDVNTFGTTLISRPAAREAFLAARAYSIPKDSTDTIELDFSHVKVLTPSWADEFITKIKERYSARVMLLDSDNPSVKATLALLHDIEA